MSSFSRFLLGTGVGVGIYAGVRYMLGLKKMQDEIEIIPTVNIHKLDLKGLVIKIDVQMKNPTQGTVNLQFPQTGAGLPVCDCSLLILIER